MVCSWLAFCRAVIASTVPVAVVRPGIIETKIPVILPVSMETIEAFFSIRFCVRGSTCLFWDDWFGQQEFKRVGHPKSPASAGNKTGAGKPTGEVTCISKMTMPKSPERRNTNAAKIHPKDRGECSFITKVHDACFFCRDHKENDRKKYPDHTLSDGGIQ